MLSLSTYAGMVMRFLDAKKVFLEDYVSTHLLQYYSSETMGFFDDMVDKVGEYILSERELCGLQNLITDTASQIFRKAMPVRYSNVPDNNAVFDECSKDVFISTYNGSLQRARREMEQPIMRLAHITHYKQVLSNYTDSIQAARVSTQCADALIKLKYCDGCSGNYSDQSVKKQCRSQCQATMDVCLYPYKVMETAANNWISNKIKLIESLKVFPLSGMFIGARQAILQSVLSAVEGATIPALVRFRCGVALTTRPPPVRRRSVHRVDRRQNNQEVDLLAAVLEEVECITNQTASLYFPSMVSELCINSTAVGCTDSRERVVPNLLSPVQGEIVDELILRSNYIRKIAFACSDVNVCPNIEDYCWVNNLMVNKTPTAEPKPPETTSSSSIQSSSASVSMPESVTPSLSTSSAAVTDSTSMPPSPKPSVFPTTGHIELKPRYWTDIHIHEWGTGTQSTFRPHNSALSSQLSVSLIVVLLIIIITIYSIQ